jgi:hypothetical protein
MGWKSTIDITRARAIEIIADANLDELSDEELCDIVETIAGGENHGYNYRIVDEVNDE